MTSQSRLMLKAISMAVLIGCACAKVGAADANPIDPTLLRRFEARTFTASGHTLRYRLAQPLGYDARTNYPLVLFLHGAAGLGDDNIRQFNGGNEVVPRALTMDDAQRKFPCFVLAPQCPRGSSWTGFGAPSPMIRATLAALESLKQEFRVNSRRIYVVGVSMGGGGVWDTITRFPTTFAAAVPICGVGDTSIASKVVGLPIWCFHGADDHTVPVEYARKMIAALRKAGGNPRYTEYPGVGHDSYRNAFKEPDLLPWLFAQQRND